MNDDPYVLITEIMPQVDTCCWVYLAGIEGPVPAMWTGERWVFQVKEFERYRVTHWRVNATGCRWYARARS